MHTHFFIFLPFLLFFWAGPSSAHMGWARPSRAKANKKHACCVPCEVINKLIWSVKAKENYFMKAKESLPVLLECYCFGRRSMNTLLAGKLELLLLPLLSCPLLLLLSIVCLLSASVLGLFVPLCFLGFSSWFYLSFSLFFSRLKSHCYPPFQSPVFLPFFLWFFFHSPLGSALFFSSSPVRIPSLAFIVGEWHPSPLVMKTQDCYCRSNEGMRIVHCPFLVWRRWTVSLEMAPFWDVKWPFAFWPLNVWKFCN